MFPKRKKNQAFICNSLTIHAAAFFSFRDIGDKIAILIRVLHHITQWNFTNTSLTIEKKEANSIDEFAGHFFLHSLSFEITIKYMYLDTITTTKLYKRDLSLITKGYTNLMIKFLKKYICCCECSLRELIFNNKREVKVDVGAVNELFV